MVKSHTSGKIAHARLCAVITCTWESKGRAASSKDMEKENVSPSKNNHLVKKQRLSLSLKCKHRFRAAPDNDLAKLSKPQIPKNTDVSTRSQTGIKIITLEIQKNLVWRKLFRQSAVPHCWTHGCVFLFQKQEIKMVSNIHRSYYSLLTAYVYVHSNYPPIISNYSSEPPMVPPLVPVDYNVHSTYLPNYSSEQCDEKNYDC